MSIMAAARVIEMIAGVGRAPIGEHADQPPIGQVRLPVRTSAGRQVRAPVHECGDLARLYFPVEVTTSSPERTKASSNHLGKKFCRTGVTVKPSVTVQH